MATSIGQYTPVFLPGEALSLTEKPGRPQSIGLQRVGHDWSDPAHIHARCFFSLWHLCPSESWAWRWHSFLACRDPGGAKVQGQGLPLSRTYGPIRVFFQASWGWQSEGLFGQSFSEASPIQSLRACPCLGPFFPKQCCNEHPFTCVFMHLG